MKSSPSVTPASILFAQFFLAKIRMFCARKISVPHFLIVSEKKFSGADVAERGARLKHCSSFLSAVIFYRKHRPE